MYKSLRNSILRGFNLPPGRCASPGQSQTFIRCLCSNGMDEQGTADVVIVGGGMVGAALAALLCEFPAQRAECLNCC